MRIAVIINPVAGRGRRRPQGAERAELAARLVGRTGVEPAIALTRAPGHAADLARGFVAAGYDVIAAWGGDGTINEVAGPLLRSQAALAIVPSGSGDGLARGLGLPADAPGAFAAAASGRSASMDVGFMGDRHFLNIAGVGFDAAVAAAFHRAGRYGVLSYAAHAATSIWTYRCEPYRVTLDAERMEGRRFVVAFANSGQYGNGFVISPDADPSDGWLNAVVVADGTPLAQLWRARRLFVRPLRPAGGVRRVRVQTASVEGELLGCHVDGEPFEARGILNVRIEPAAVRVVGLARLSRPSA